MGQNFGEKTKIFGRYYYADGMSVNHIDNYSAVVQALVLTYREVIIAATET